MPPTPAKMRHDGEPLARVESGWTSRKPTVATVMTVM